MSRSLHVIKGKKIYGNCQVLSPDDILMFRCDEKKANWYLNRNLGDIVGSDPLVVKLKFKPNGLGNHDKDFGLSEMTNRCVICGNEEFLNRHHVVPYCYRKYFPNALKSHNFHDVVSICIDCHEKYERRADELKLYLEEKYDAPIGGLSENKYFLLKYIKNANTLLSDDTNIPSKRVNVMRNEIKVFFNIKRLTKTRLQKISMLKDLITIKKTHGEIVMENIDNIQEFIQMWRKHFIDNTEPKYLPDNWNINNKL